MSCSREFRLSGADHGTLPRDDGRSLERPVVWICQQHAGTVDAGAGSLVLPGASNGGAAWIARRPASTEMCNTAASRSTASMSSTARRARRTRRSCCCRTATRARRSSSATSCRRSPTAGGCIAPDFPGFGYSDTPDGFAYDFDGYADFLERFADALGLDALRPLPARLRLADRPAPRDAAAGARRGADHPERRHLRGRSSGPNTRAEGVLARARRPRRAPSWPRPSARRASRTSS